MSDPWLVVGLGNPGPTYEWNRHNVGAMVVELMAHRASARFSSHRGRADVASILAPGSSERLVLMRPRSYMNESGGPVVAVRDFYKIPTERMIVIHDELDLGFGVLRLKRGGGDNGHNGLRSVTRSLGPDYLRVRVGIGRPPGRMDPAAFVLRDFAPAERAELDFVVDRAADAVEALASSGLEVAQNRFNG